jgi:uncharacterized membrane protein YcjF (UPF0283 family)
LKWKLGNIVIVFVIVYLFGYAFGILPRTFKVFIPDDVMAFAVFIVAALGISLLVNYLLQVEERIVQLERQNETQSKK